MKKVLLSLIVVCAFGLQDANAQAQKYMNFGGLGTGLYFGMEFPVAAPITLGFHASTNYNFDNLYVAGKGNYYFDELFPLPSEWDFYAGLNLGWRIDGNDNKNGNDGFSFGGQVGGRWFWSDRWGINGEFGWGNGALGGVGVTMTM